MGDYTFDCRLFTADRAVTYDRPGRRQSVMLDSNYLLFKITNKQKTSPSPPKELPVPALTDQPVLGTSVSMVFKTIKDTSGWEKA